MKSSEYVAIVTKIFRKYLNIYKETGKYAVDEEELMQLSQFFNRANFTSGYLFGDPWYDLMSGFLPKHQGVAIGRPLTEELIEEQLKKTGGTPVKVEQTRVLMDKSIFIPLYGYYIKQNFDRIADYAVGSGIAIGNLGWIRPFADKDVSNDHPSRIKTDNAFQL